MLTEAEKEKIRELEDFRKEVRDLLSPATPKTTKTRIWEALNSNFGIWLLSAVLVSGLGTLYARHQTQADAEQKKREGEAAEARRIGELRDRLKLEISFRLSSALSRLDELDRLKDKRTATTNDIQRALAPLALPASDSSPPLFPEYKSYSGLALIAELRRHSEEGEKQILKTILAKTSGLLNESYGETASSKRTARETAINLLHQMRNPAWDNGFPFTDCPDDNPFC